MIELTFPRLLMKINHLILKNSNFNYQKYICNGCHDLMQKAISFNNVAIVEFILGI